MAKLKCTSVRVNNKMHPAKHLAGTIHNFPIIGQVTFSKDNVIEIEDKLVSSFLKLECGFEFEEIKKKDLKKGKEEDENESNLSEKELYKKGLLDLKPEELDALVSINPDKETKKLKTDNAKINYLVNKQYPE